MQFQASVEKKNEKLNPTKPSRSPKSSWAPVLCKCLLTITSSAHTLSFPSPSPSRDSDSSYHSSTDPLSWIIPILRGDLWVPAGHDRRHRWESRPVMASICHIALLSRPFLKCFSSHRSSLFCSLKQAEREGRGECRRGQRGSDLMPNDTAQT